jgi:hypothetical protein
VMTSPAPMILSQPATSGGAGISMPGGVGTPPSSPRNAPDQPSRPPGSEGPLVPPNPLPETPGSSAAPFSSLGGPSARR